MKKKYQGPWIMQSFLRLTPPSPPPPIYNLAFNNRLSRSRTETHCTSPFHSSMAEGGSDTKPPSPPQSSPAHEAASQPQSAGPSPAEQAQVKKARDYLDLAQKKMASSQTFMGKLFG